jgi:FkbM family methyltransferase
MPNIIQNLLRKIGLQVEKYPNKDLKRRLKIISHFNINLLFDIGANSGQYALNIRSIGYSYKIVSFEPLTEAFKLLIQFSKNDPLWEVKKIALGNVNEERKINISKNSYSSSLLNMYPSHVNAAPSAVFINQKIY